MPSLRVPPPEVPIVKWLSPNKADQGLLEFWNTEVASYVPLDTGSAHPNTRLYPGFTLGKQSPLQGDEKWVARIWVTPETSPEWFNYAEKFSAEDNAYPIFIRTYREPKSTYQPRAKQSSLGAFYKLVLDNPGSGFTNGTLPEVAFDSESPTPALAHGVVSADGTLAECVLDFCGEGYTGNVAFTVDAPANGNPASGTAYIQPATAILVREEANQYPEDSEFYAQYFQVVRVYETLPGPTLYSTRIDTDGVVVTIGTTRKLCADISSGEGISGGIWTVTTKKQTDIDFVCEEVVETRAIPGQEIDRITYPYGPNGRRVTASRLVERSTYTRTANGTANANFASALLVDESLEPVEGSLVVARKVGIYDEIPTAANQQGLGYFVDYPYDGDPDFPRLTWRFQILRLSATTVTDLSACPISGFTALKLVDQKTEEADELIEVKVVRIYEVLPGKPIPSTKLDKYGCPIDEVRTKKDESTIVTLEEIAAGNIWKKTSKEAIGGGVAWEVVEAQDLDSVNNVPSATVDGDHEVAVITAKLQAASGITPSATESGGSITTVEKKEVTDLVSEKVTTVVPFLDKATYSQRIPESIIPIEFRATIPTVVESHILAGTASMPTLSGSEFFVQEQQLTKLLYERRTESLGDITFPVVQHGQENSTEYGGALLDVVRTLDDSALTADEGEDIVASVMNPIGDNLMWFRETKKRPSGDAEWPTIDSDYFDKEMQVKALVEEQVVDPGYTEATGTYFIESLKGIDKWRSKRTKLTREPTAISLATALIEEVDGPFQFPGLVFLAPGGGGYYRRQASAQLCQQIIRTWWMSSPTMPTRGLPGSGDDVEVQDIIMDDIVISTLNNVTVLDYSGMCLHDAITTFGVFVYAATEPSYTAYAAMIGTEIVVAASIEPTEIPELWKIQTKSVVAR